MSQDPKNRFRLDEDESTVPEMGVQEEQTPSDYGTKKSDSGSDDYASPERFENDKAALIDFLRFPTEKRKLTEFLEETYKTIEQESVDRTINRVVHEHQSELDGSKPFYKPGHIGPLMYEYLNMVGVEAAFVSGLQHTKSSMTKTVQQRVDEINTLLRGVGGFNRQIKASFSRSAVVYLEQEDPNSSHRERIIFTVNLGDFELRYPLDETASEQLVEDGRTVRRLVWDEAVNTLAEIISNTGMKPKYVKNDKNTCTLIMRQYLLSDTESDQKPDEYFGFELKHLNEEAKERLGQEYVEKLEWFETMLTKMNKKLNGFWVGEKTATAYKREIDRLTKERDFYIATMPDPREMDTGLVFSIYANTLKDYTITKDKMQVIMTKYILALSKIAVDKSMDQQVNTVYQAKQGKATNVQSLEIVSNKPGIKAVGGMKKEPPKKVAAGGSKFKI